jgi:hypothetical protein
VKNLKTARMVCPWDKHSRTSSFLVVMQVDFAKPIPIADPTAKEIGHLPQESEDVNTFNWVELDDGEGFRRSMACGPCGQFCSETAWSVKRCRFFQKHNLLSHARTLGHRCAMIQAYYMWFPTSKYRVAIKDSRRGEVCARLNINSSNTFCEDPHPPPPLPISALLLPTDVAAEAMLLTSDQDDAHSFSEAGLIDIFASVVSEDGMEGAEAAAGSACRCVQSEPRNSRDEKKICAESDVEISCLNSSTAGTA